MATDVQMTAAIIDGGTYETVHYPDDELLLRVTEGAMYKLSNTSPQTARGHRHILMRGMNWNMSSKEMWSSICMVSGCKPGRVAFRCYRLVLPIP